MGDREKKRTIRERTKRNMGVGCVCFLFSAARGGWKEQKERERTLGDLSPSSPLLRGVDYESESGEGTRKKSWRRWVWCVQWRMHATYGGDPLTVLFGRRIDQSELYIASHNYSQRDCLVDIDWSVFCIPVNDACQKIKTAGTPCSMPRSLISRRSQSHRCKGGND